MLDVCYRCSWCAVYVVCVVMGENVEEEGCPGRPGIGLLVVVMIGDW